MHAPTPFCESLLPAHRLVQAFCTSFYCAHLCISTALRLFLRLEWHITMFSCFCLGMENVAVLVKCLLPISYNVCSFEGRIYTKNINDFTLRVDRSNNSLYL